MLTTFSISSYISQLAKYLPAIKTSDVVMFQTQTYENAQQQVSLSCKKLKPRQISLDKGFLVEVCDIEVFKKGLYFQEV